MQKVKNTLSIAFKIRPGEGPATLMLLIHSFFMGITLVFLETASYALFLTEFDIEYLPWVYIGSAAITAFFGFFYSKFEEHLAFSRLLILTVGALLFSIVVFYVSMLLAVTQWLVMCLIIWYNVVLVLINLEFWGLANRLLNVRQGKRLFGLIGTGEIFAEIFAGLSVSVLARLIGTLHLLAFSIVGMVACLFVLFYITRKMARRIAEPEEEEEESLAGGVASSQLNKNRYLYLIVGVAALSIFGYYLLDYVFYNQLEARYPDEDQLAVFLGIFTAVYGIVKLISNAFLHSRLIERYGLSLGLMAVPVVVAIGSISALAAGIVSAFGLFFWIVTITKGIEEISRVSIEEPSFRILYQPFPAGQRLKAQTILETMVEPLAAAIVGAVLLLLTSVLSLGPVYLIYLICFVLIGWVVAALLLRNEYTKALTRALNKRRLGGAALSLGDASSIDVLRKGLNSEIPGEVINCLNMLEDVEHESLEEFIIELLDHPDDKVRRHVLERIESMKIYNAAEAIKRRLELEKDHRVLGIALRTLCAIAEAEAFEDVFAYLEDPDMDMDVKRGAMAGLLSNGGIDGVLSAGTKLTALLDSDEAEDRKLAAEVLGEVGIASFYRPLLKLLDDPEIKVRAAATQASGKLKNPRLFPKLLENLSAPDMSTTATNAIVNYGVSILPELEAAFDREGQTHSMRIRIVRIIGKIGGETAINILKKKIDFAEVEIRSHILSALVMCRYQADIQEIDRIHDRIRKEVEDATWTLSVLVDIGDYEDGELLIKALKSEVEKNRRRIFSLLSLIYPASAISQSQLNLESSSKDNRANALEVLDNLIAQEIKSYVFPLVDEIPSSQRLGRLVQHFPQKRMSRHERLKEILSRSQQWTSSWAKTCALFAIGNIATKEFYDAVVASLSDPDNVVRETAVWALGALNPDDLVSRLKPMKKDRAKNVADFARFVINSVGFSSIPMGKSGYLTRSGRYTADLFANILQDNEERRLRRCRAANILSRFKVPAARTALVDSLNIQDKTVRTAVLDALIKGDFAIETPEREALSELLRIEMNDAHTIVESMLVFLNERRAKRLVDALKREMNHNRRRMLSILALLCTDRIFVKTSLATLFYWYIHQTQRKVPENIAARLRHLLTQTNEAPEVQNGAFLLFQQRNPVRLKELLNLPGAYAEDGMEAHLRQIAFGSQVFTLSWSRICALDMIVRMNLHNCVEQILDLLKKGDDVVRATSAWALYRLDPEAYFNLAGELRNDASYLVSQTARQLGGGADMADADEL